MAVLATSNNNNNDTAKHVEPLDLGDRFSAVAGATLEGAGVNGPESVQFFTHGIQLQLRVENPDDDDNKMGEAIGKTISAIQKLQHIQADQISFFNHENKKFSCADIPQKADAVKTFFNWRKSKVSRNQFTNVEVFIYVRIVYYDFWHKVKAPMMQWMKEHKVFMKPCRGRTSEELLKIGFLGDGMTIMNRAYLADRMTVQMQAALDAQSDSWLSERNATRTTRCFLEITQEPVVTSYQNRLIEIQGLVVLCPKHMIELHVGLMKQALNFSKPTKDLNDLQFVPFKYKDSKVLKDGNLIFAKMIQTTKNKSKNTVVHTVNGISTVDMEQILPDILEQCPTISHIEPAKSVERNGQWKVFSRTNDSDTVRQWLGNSLNNLLDEIMDRTIFDKVPVSLRKEWKPNPYDNMQLSVKVKAIELDLESFPELPTGKTPNKKAQKARPPLNAWTHKLPKEHGDLSSAAIQRLKQLVKDQQLIESQERQKLYDSHQQSLERIAAGHTESLERPLVTTCEKVDQVFTEISAVTSGLNSIEDGQAAVSESMECMSKQLQQLTRLFQRFSSGDLPNETSGDKRPISATHPTPTKEPQSAKLKQVRTDDIPDTARRERIHCEMWHQQQSSEHQHMRTDSPSRNQEIGEMRKKAEESRRHAQHSERNIGNIQRMARTLAWMSPNKDDGTSL